MIKHRLLFIRGGPNEETSDEGCALEQLAETFEMISILWMKNVKNE